MRGKTILLLPFFISRTQGLKNKILTGNDLIEEGVHRA